MKLNLGTRGWGYFLLYAALLTLPALVVDVRAYSTFEPVKVLATVGLATLLGWWMIMGWMMGWGAIGDEVRTWRPTWESFKRNPALWYFSGYWISIVVATVASVAPAVSFFGIAPRYQGLILYMVIFVVSLGAMRLGRELRGGMRVETQRVLEVTMIGAVVVSAFGILQGLVPSLTRWWDIENFLGRAFSTMGHPSYLADYLLLVAPLFYWKWVSSRKWWLVWSLLGVIVGVAFLLTQSRGAVAGLVVSLLFFVGVYGHWHRRKGLVLSAIITPLLLVVIVAGVNFTGLRGVASETPLLGRLVVSEENMRSVGTRMTLWPAVMGRVMQRPILGYGPDTFGLSFAAVAPSELLQSENFNAYADRAHNFFLDTLMNVGVVGLGFLIIVFGLAIRIVIRSGDVLLLALGSALFGHIISQQFEFSLTVHLIFFWTYIGIILGWKRGGDMSEGKLDRESNKPIRIMKSVVASVIVVGIFVGYIVPTGRADRLAREEGFGRAIVLAPHRMEYVLMEARRRIEEGKEEESILALLEKVKRFTGDLDYRPYFYEGTFWGGMGEYPKAFLSFEEAIKRSPTFPPLYKAYGKMLLESGDGRGALAQFERYLKLAPRTEKRDRVFYKLNPGFDEIFELIEEARIAM